MTDDNTPLTDNTPSTDSNVVRLAGRISAAPEVRVLPSGDEIVTFRLVVRRSVAARRRSNQVVDTIECSVWRSALKRSVLEVAPGTEVAVTGELRRRFSRGGGGVVSWVSVDVDTCQRTRSPTVASEA